MGKRRRRTWVLGVAALAVAGWLVLDRYSTPSDPLRAWPGLSQERRHRVAERLVADGILIGMGESELREHLGEPGYTWDGRKTLGWFVGDPPGSAWFTLDSDFLEVKLEGGRVLSARIRTSRF